MKTKLLLLIIDSVVLLVPGDSVAKTKGQSMPMIKQAYPAYDKVDKKGNYARAYEETKNSLAQSKNAWQQYLDNKDAGKVKLLTFMR